jgi:hypothetical protein
MNPVPSRLSPSVVDELVRGSLLAESPQESWRAGLARYVATDETLTLLNALEIMRDFNDMIYRTRFGYVDGRYSTVRDIRPNTALAKQAMEWVRQNKLQRVTTVLGLPRVVIRGYPVDTVHKLIGGARRQTLPWRVPQHRRFSSRAWLSATSPARRAETPEEAAGALVLAMPSASVHGFWKTEYLAPMQNSQRDLMYSLVSAEAAQFPHEYATAFGAGVGAPEYSLVTTLVLAALDLPDPGDAVKAVEARLRAWKAQETSPSATMRRPVGTFGKRAAYCLDLADTILAKGQAAWNEDDERIFERVRALYRIKHPDTRPLTRSDDDAGEWLGPISEEDDEQSSDDDASDVDSFIASNSDDDDEDPDADYEPPPKKARRYDVYIALACARLAVLLNAGVK